ncbi:actin family [Radiomyces spectabilis]|uniref:actin family n=1 Tax=Radiomyces spectabilis TaxID=64574 RepID=UPI00221F3E7F|nr:actin family [Radiomyces spectabilis]KAI8381057.1 actin family [Radiomyces spectabilis]
MALTLREENFIVIDNGSQIIRAGIGMNDTNKPPSVNLSMAAYNHPIQRHTITSWQDMEACWNHILFKELGLKKSRNESPVLLTVPVQWTKEEYERITQIFFEEFNVPGIYITQQPVLALYGCGSVSGIVIDIGDEMTDVNVVIDSIVQQHSNFAIPIGGRQFDQYLLRLMKEDSALVEQMKTAQVDLDEEFARYVREQPDVCVVSVGHTVEENLLSSEVPSAVDIAPTSATEEFLDGATDGTSKLEEEPTDVPDNVEIEYKGHKFTVGAYRHKVMDPLFTPDLCGFDALSFNDAMRLAVMNCEPPEMRPKLWENIVLTGGCSQASQLQRRIKATLQVFLPRSDNAGDSQPRVLGFLRIPDYFTVLKDRQYQRLSTWLGAEIVAKLVFIDAKNYISKVDYNEHGPSVIHTKSF